MIEFALGLIVGVLIGGVVTIVISNKPFELKIEFKED